MPGLKNTDFINLINIMRQNFLIDEYNICLNSQTLPDGGVVLQPGCIRRGLRPAIDLADIDDNGEAHNLATPLFFYLQCLV